MGTKPRRGGMFVLVFGTVLAIGPAGQGADDLRAEQGHIGPPSQLPSGRWKRATDPVELASRTPAADAVNQGSRGPLALPHKEKAPAPLAWRPPVRLAQPALTIGPLPPSTSVVSAQDSSRIELRINRALRDRNPVEVPSARGGTGMACEPNVAVTEGDEILLAGNWFAAYSADGGKRFLEVDPFVLFPAPDPDSIFQSDQIVLYEPRRRLMFWLLQYTPTSTNNVLRLAVARRQDLAGGAWRYYDFTPQVLGRKAKAWFDFPEIVLGTNYLYLAANVYSDPGQKAIDGAVVLRLPLASLAAYKGFDFAFFKTSTANLRGTEGAGRTMHWVAHRGDLKTVQGYSWSEDRLSIHPWQVTVDGWHDRREGDYVAPGPDGNDWLEAADGRISTAWKGTRTIGFAWTARHEPDAGLPFPHVRVALVDEESKKVLAQPHLWNPEFAFAFPAAAVNSDGRVGLSVCFGGGKYHPSHAVGVLLPAAGNPPRMSWYLRATGQGTDGPSHVYRGDDQRWGDFITIHPHPQHPATWVTAGYTLQNGDTKKHVQVRYIHFAWKDGMK